jgi:hypothetical protein
LKKKVKELIVQQEFYGMSAIDKELDREVKEKCLQYRKNHDCDINCPVLQSGECEYKDTTHKELYEKYLRVCLNPPEGAFSFVSRGLREDLCTSCFVCSYKTPQYTSPKLYNSIAGFVRSKETGEKIVEMFPAGAWLDIRPYSLNSWIQVKICACDKHISQLEELNKLIKQFEQIRPEYITQVVNQAVL